MFKWILPSDPQRPIKISLVVPFITTTALITRGVVPVSSQHGVVAGVSLKIDVFTTLPSATHHPSLAERKAVCSIWCIRYSANFLLGLYFPLVNLFSHTCQTMSCLTTQFHKCHFSLLQTLEIIVINGVTKISFETLEAINENLGVHCLPFWSTWNTNILAVPTNHSCIIIKHAISQLSSSSS